MTDSRITRERNEDIEKSQAARPAILSGLRSGDELLTISERIAAEHNVDEKKAYRWVSIIDEEFTRRRKTVSTIGLLVLWLGALTVVSGLIMVVIGFSAEGLFGFSLSLTFIAGGLIVMTPGAVLSLMAAKLVYRVRS